MTHGLLGAFIVQPKDTSSEPEYDRESTLILNDDPIGQVTTNGKRFPAANRSR